ncbi:MAG TPA: chemotaxis protein CheW [bacterium]|nr:chemotaxis protein CheW [bacterium]HPN43195.1 chemotaxis protein CheW [bacterium]
MDRIRLDKTLIAQIKSIAKKLQKFNPDDRQELISIGKLTEEIKSQIPYDYTELVAIFIMSLEGLQAIYNKQLKAPDLFSKTMAEFFVKLSDSLLTEDNEKIQTAIMESGQEIWTALGRDPKTSPYLTKTEKIIKSNMPELVLNDVAALLMQLASTDVKELLKIRPSLENIEKDKSLPDVVQQNISRAIEHLGKIAQNPAANNESLFAEISSLISQALDILEGGTAKRDVKSAKPEPAIAKKAESNQVYSLPSDFDADIINEFIAESNEYLEDAESALLQLENNPNDAEAINVVFRAFHTIKGTSGFLQLSLCSGFAHVAESFFSRIRDGEITCTGHNADLSLKSIDMVKSLIHAVELAIGGQPLTKPANYDQLIEALSAEEPSAIPLVEKSAPVTATVEKAEPVTQGAATRPVEAVKASEKIPMPAVDTPQMKIEKAPVQAASADSGSTTGVDPFVRVRTDRLDDLIEMVGELVIAQSMISQDFMVLDEQNPDFTRKVIHAGKIVRELQDLSLSMRMIPLSSTFQKMSRLVRDLSSKTNKKVNFIQQGEDTEIDRKMVELIKDPIIHMLRNAMDHGIESPQEREQLGKPSVGTIKMSAYHSGGSVMIKIEDDGRGLNREKILKKAIEKGIIDNEKNLSENDVYNLIFAPGFSTAEKVTDVSGRGVGLDVVKKNIEQLHGRIDIDTIAGMGCSFTLSFPLTIAIIDGMLVKIGEEFYIIPIIDIQMSLQPEKKSLFSVAQRGEMVMYQDTLIPIYRMYHLFDITNAITDPTAGLLVIIGDGEKKCALLVDQLMGQQQVVTKSLGEDMQNIKGISGGAILGDGRVGLILDTSDLITLARETSKEKMPPARTGLLKN